MIRLRDKFYIEFFTEFGIPKKLVRLIKMCPGKTYIEFLTEFGIPKKLVRLIKMRPGKT